MPHPVATDRVALDRAAADLARILKQIEGTELLTAKQKQRAAEHVRSAAALLLGAAA